MTGPSKTTTDLPVVFTAGKSLLILLGFFFTGIFLATFTSSLSASFFGARSWASTLIQSLGLSAFAFILPAWGAYRMDYANPMRRLGVDHRVSAVAIAGMAMVYVIALPAMNQIILWNGSMHLPGTLQGLEQSWREMEEANGRLAAVLTSQVQVWRMLVNVLTVGVVTGFAEELFFRGAFQGILIHARVGKSASVWITAIVFSLMHFQMFGFVPRLLLGAWFGYLYVWSGSLWLSVSAHALNNSLVVIVAWLMNIGIAGSSLDSIGAVGSGAFPWIALGSALATAVLIPSYRRYVISSSRLDKA